MKVHKGEYNGRECLVSVVEDSDGGTGTHHVVTSDGLVPVRTGDYVVHGVTKAPPGYHSQAIDMVVRGKGGKPRNSKLSVGDPLEADEVDEELELEEADDEFFADDEDDEPKQSANKRTPAKATPATPAKATTPASGSK